MDSNAFASYANLINSTAYANNEWSAAQAQRQMDFQREMSNTAHVREVEDLKAAGLNPVLSAGGSGATTGSGAMGGTDTSNTAALMSLIGKALESNISSSRTMSNVVNEMADTVRQRTSDNLKDEFLERIRNGDSSGSGSSKKEKDPYNYVLTGNVLTDLPKLFLTAQAKAWDIDPRDLDDELINRLSDPGGTAKKLWNNWLDFINVPDRILKAKGYKGGRYVSPAIDEVVSSAKDAFRKKTKKR